MPLSFTLAVIVRRLVSEHSEIDDVIELPSIGCHLALRAVYDQVLVAIKEEGPEWHLTPLQEDQ